MEEQEKYEVIKNVADGNTGKLRASVKLGITVRQVNRLLKNIGRLVRPDLLMKTVVRNT